MPSKERYEARKVAGLCTSCGRVPEPNRSRCIACSKYRGDRKQLRKKVLDHYGRRCVCCGTEIQQFLTLDHKNNDGNVHRKQVLGVHSRSNSQGMYRWIIRNGFPGFIQVLCFNCNIGKHLNHGVCPHVEFGGRKTAIEATGGKLPAC